MHCNFQDVVLISFPLLFSEKNFFFKSTLFLQKNILKDTLKAFDDFKNKQQKCIR